MFPALGIKDTDIEKDEVGAASTHPDIKARKVLICWRKREGKQATRQALLDGLTRCGNVHAKEMLEDKWNGKGIGTVNIVTFILLFRKKTAITISVSSGSIVMENV